MRYLQIFLLAFILSIAPSVRAQEIIGEHIRSFDAQITIQKSGVIEVTETIQYDFGPDQRHGIYRYIPNIKTNAEGKKFKMDIDVQSVTNEQGEQYRFEKSESDNQLELKIGDPNRTITGVNTYSITYTVAGALTYFTEYDELYWNITGNVWSIPIAQSSATINLPEGVEATAITGDCYTGLEGENTATCVSQILDSQVVFSSTSSLNPSEGLTIAVTFPKNIVSVIEPTEVVSFWDSLQGKIILVVLIVLGVFWYVIYPLYLPFQWFLTGRDPSSHVGKVQALFESPKTKSGRHLTPAETGTLIDEHAGPREISALLVDLARRGYIKIIENKKNDFTLEKTKEFAHDSSLRRFEKTLLTGIFEDGNTLRLKGAKLYDTVKKVQDQLYHSIVHEGYFPENPNKVRSIYNGMIGAAAVTFNVLLLLSASIFGRIMPKKTMEGVHAANLARSLKNFLTSQERQLEFQAKNQLFFEKLLPFAVAFGVEKVWANRFKDIDLKEPEWYVSSTPSGVFTASAFTRSLNSSFSSFNSAATPPTSSSGFSSGGGGGGFSGGGGGGGGGGSW